MAHLLAILLMLFCTLASARLAHAEPTPPTVAGVLGYYRVRDYLDQAMPAVEQALARRRKEVSLAETQAQEILALARRIFRKGNLMTVFEAAYAKQITLDNLKALHAFQLTPPGIRLRRGIDAAYKAEARERQAYFDKESPKLLKPNRKNAINTYINAHEQVDLQTTLMTGADLVVHRALASYLPKAARDSLRSMKERVRARKTGYNETARQEFFVFDFYVLRELKNEELDSLSQFATTPVGQAGTRALIKSLELTMESAGATLVAQLTKEGG